MAGYDAGYGSPTITVHLTLWQAAEGARYPDEGGAVLDLLGAWPVPGPYRVRLLDAEGTPYPDSGGAYSARPGESDAARTDKSQRLLKFSLPPLPVGVYDIEVAWGPSWSTVAVAAKAIEVVRRNRALSVYRIRGRFQGTVFEVGPRRMAREPRTVAVP
jgi:hypothetical protein